MLGIRLFKSAVIKKKLTHENREHVPYYELEAKDKAGSNRY
ncbi:hypothetical protein SAMN05421755_104117 [Nitrosomonas sp. Nm33]|nr:hypothetical protein SAMN05421755_104117 [Nitrosomonas sp. Nm33]